jgi:hypothetical protein
MTSVLLRRAPAGLLRPVRRLAPRTPAIGPMEPDAATLARPQRSEPQRSQPPLEAKPAAAPRHRRSWRLITASVLAWILAGLVLFSCFLHMSATVPVNSDGASNALQAWAMLHGNPLLRGWQLSDVSFYTTELPQYMLIELARGLTPDVVHIAAAMTYAFVVLLVARLAKGEATGTAGLLRACLAAGIMVAPQRSEVAVLMLSPDHVGSTVPVLLMWLLIDRAGRRWYVPCACCALLGWALVADQVVLLTGVLALLLVALTRAYHAIIRQRARVRSVVFELALAASGLAGAEAGWRALALIRSSGGFLVWPVNSRLVSFAGCRTT